MQTLYRLVYQLAENNGASYFSSAPSIINIINALGATKFARVISDREPDVIICTHVFAAQMVDELKKAQKARGRHDHRHRHGLHAPSVLGGSCRACSISSRRGEAR
ncbi:MAG: MGDG synthase family glycosyltransferase [Butyricicoccaceae bacterium]